MVAFMDYLESLPDSKDTTYVLCSHGGPTVFAASYATTGAVADGWVKYCGVFMFTKKAGDKLWTMPVENYHEHIKGMDSKDMVIMGNTVVAQVEEDDAVAAS